MKRWIVIEWNQASGQPRIIADGEMFWTEGEAESIARDERELTAAVGRRERFTVHEIDLEDA
ncbi:hypothetical protein [Microbacterium sp. USHLN272]|uniref:hypothetical protein n=1 Tax=Microbacterium sp. USHLN272 TaxID=3081287 RepID=UPI003019A66E